MTSECDETYAEVREQKERIIKINTKISSLKEKRNIILGEKTKNDKRRVCRNSAFERFSFRQLETARQVDRLMTENNS